MWVIEVTVNTEQLSHVEVSWASAWGWTSVCADLRSFGCRTWNKDFSAGSLFGRWSKKTAEQMSSRNKEKPTQRCIIRVTDVGLGDSIHPRPLRNEKMLLRIVPEVGGWSFLLWLLSSTGWAFLSVLTYNLRGCFCMTGLLSRSILHIFESTLPAEVSLNSQNGLPYSG